MLSESTDDVTNWTRSPYCVNVGHIVLDVVNKTIAIVALGDHELKHDAGPVPEISNSSFYLVQTDDNGQTSSAMAGDVTQVVSGDVAQVTTSDQTANVSEPKTNDNSESFCFLDDKSVPLNVDSLEPALSVVPVDTEVEEEQHLKDEPESAVENESEAQAETTVEAAAVEIPPPEVSLATSVNDPDSLLTSVRLVIGALH